MLLDLVSLHTIKVCLSKPRFFLLSTYFFPKKKQVHFTHETG